MAALGTLVVERALDGLALTVLLLIFAAAVDSSDRLWQLVLFGAVLFGLATVVLVFAALNQERCLSLVVIVIDRGPARWRRHLRKWSKSFLTGTTALGTPTGMAGVVLTTAGFWFSVALVYAIVGQAFDIDEGVPTYLFVTAAANLSVSIPSSQGGLGPFEFFVRETLEFSGVGAPLATAYALVLHATILATMIIMGFISLRMIGLSWGSLSGQVPADSEAEEELSSLPDREQEHLPAEEQVKGRQQ
jgi:uncharacterized membrane protein YbhN (UPF0104 family)